MGCARSANTERRSREWHPRKFKTELLSPAANCSSGSDFPHQATTTTAPPRITRLETRIAPEISNDPKLLDGVHEANAVLEEEFLRSGTRVSASWDVVPTPTDLHLARLTLTDIASRSTVEGLFTSDVLSNLRNSRFPLFRLWDDLLREKAHGLMMQASGKEG